MNFQCVPNNYPAGTNATDCNIWPSVKVANNERGDAAIDYFPQASYYYNCQSNGMGTPGCALGYTSLGLKSYKDFGLSCGIGNGKIPTQIDNSTGIITCATDSNGNCLVRESKSQCDSLLNLVPINTSGANGVNTLVCSDG
jgi:hypothetical protein